MDNITIYLKNKDTVNYVDVDVESDGTGIIPIGNCTLLRFAHRHSAYTFNMESIESFVLWEPEPLPDMGKDWDGTEG